MFPGVYKTKTKTHTTIIQYRVDFQHPVQIDLFVTSCLMNKRKSSKLSPKVFVLMTHSICKTKTDSKMLQKCLNSTNVVNSRCVSPHRHRETIIALHRQYNGHLEYVFILQNDPLNLQNEDRLQNATKVFKFNLNSKQLLCFLE